MRLTLQPDNSQSYDIKRIGAKVTVGRKQGSDILLTDVVVSGTHCFITVNSTTSATIEDGSTNGTYVNGIKIGKGNKVSVKDGDMLTLGKPAAVANPGVPGSFGCINLRVSFDGEESETATEHVASVIWKQDIEDMKVLLSQAEHRCADLEKRNSEATRKLAHADADLKRTSESNIELSVRNESMRNEIESLRLRMGQAEERAEAAQKRADTLQSKMDHLDKDSAELADLKAQFNLKTNSLKDEVLRLQNSNFELTATLASSTETRRRLMSNLLALKQALASSIQLCDEVAHDESPAEVRDSNTTYSPEVVQITKRQKDTPMRGTPVKVTPAVLRGIPVDAGVEAPPMVDDGLIDGLFASTQN